jgi:lipopolysaccharide export system protein LptA
MIIKSLFSLCLSTVWAQNIPLDSGQKGNLPVTIEADVSVVCDDHKGQCVATGNAEAVRGTFKVNADTLVLHFEKTGSSHDVTALSAHGHVVMSTPSEKAYGDDAHYDMAQDRLKMTGHNLKLETDKQTLTARDSLEYWRPEQKGIAYGDAVAIFPEKKQLLKADTLEAYFRSVPGAEDKDKQELDHIEAINNVFLSSPEEIITGDRGTYHAKAEFAEIFDNVTLTKGENQIEGAYATFNVKTSVGQLYGSRPGDKNGKRIHGLIIPKDAKKARGSSLVKKKEK